MKETFQFSSGSADGKATIGDVIRALNAEIIKPNGELITRQSLKRTLDFLQAAIGIKVGSTNEQLPLTTLKTIRLLFLVDQNHTKNVLHLLWPPQADGKASMEFCTVTTIPRDEEASAIIQALCESLALEIDPSRTCMLSQMLSQREDRSVAEDLLLQIERTNDQVSKILHAPFGADDALLSSAFASLTKPLNRFRVKLIDGGIPPANEAMYTYLLTLPFQQFIQHYSKRLEAVRICKEIVCIKEDAERFCKVAARCAHQHYGPASRIFSVNTCHYLLEEHPEELCELVQRASGIPTTIRQLQGHCDRIRLLLMSYAFRSLDCTDPDAAALSVYDVIAAFCSFRYQQEEGDDYKPYWHGQTDQGKNVQRLFDKGLSDERPYLHQGVIQIYLSRFYEYQASFHGTIGSYRAWMRYQIAALGAYQSVLELQDIAAIASGLSTLNVYRIAAAEDLVFDHSQVDE
ncbi:hypothetical protein [Stenotrophomonas maltophilia]|uniref:Uncharacterized protein n=1 Tax=Stenotrophomonas maltophilia TaxID=40324 RepID=A0AAJ2WPK5_STEMA|nr:hypothetical protein [Stenotrophomonas maltophilia]MBH1478403.1 hypothetical protein [Stenotrophomonas maltophilia]MBH1503746.1 hypothetical protein [Stenotrophomonas maltophilia]MDG2506772.1 hypothetical protein [Stenotrophomonas maltophilia]MDZ5766841.1 hypothetical protein [Stenotrophomonas maltophilia]HDS1656580.1 hypothetical protein [Stenotrophomonas maltophilia]